MLLAVTHEMFLRLTVGGAEGTTAKNAERLGFGLTMPAFHNSGRLRARKREFVKIL
jgi:hypothetical protein